jgi:O-antigen/teichoic acid export membrane protein
MMGSSLSAKLARNTVANYGGTFVAMAVGLVLTPFLVHELGDAHYGIWALLGSVIAYFQLLDLGLSTSLAKYVAEYLAQEREAELNQVCGTVFAAYLGLAVIAAVAIIGFAPWFAHLFNVAPEDASLATGTFLLVGLNFVILLPTSLLNAILVGYQRIDYSNIVRIISQLANAGLVILLLSRGLGLLAVAAVSIVTTLLVAGGRLYFIRRMAPQLRFSPRFFRPGVARVMFGYGAAVFVVQISGLVLFQKDNVILGFFFPVAVITPYAVTYKMAHYLDILAQPLTAVLFPAYAEMKGKLDDRRLRTLYLEGSRGVMVLSSLLGVFLLMTGTDILGLWVGPEYRDQGPILYPLLLFFVVIAVARVGGSLLVAIGQARWRMYIGLGMIVINLVLCTALASVWGPRGLAIGNAVSVLVVYGLVLIPFVGMKVGVSLVQSVRFSLLPAVLPAVLTAGYLHLSQRYYPIGDWLAAGFYLISSALLFGSAYLVVGTTRSERASYLRRLKSLFGVSAGLDKRDDMGEGTTESSETTPASGI